MLKDFCIGDSVEYISVEYAKSGRSACKTCKEKIGQNELRVGILVDDDHFSTGQGTQWFHKGCFHFKPRHKILEVSGLEKKIHNMEALSKKDQKDILSYFKADLQNAKQGKSRRKPASKSKSKAKEQSESMPKDKQEKKGKNKKESKAKNESVSKPMDKLMSKPKNNVVSKSKDNAVSKPKSKTQSRSKSKSDAQEKKRTVNPVPSTRSLRSQNEIPKKIQTVKEVETKPKKEKKGPSKSNKLAQKKFLSETQIKHYKELQNDYNELTIPQLKEILGKNNQSKTGSKGELVVKCADGKQFGRIPTCSKCGGGKLRFNRQNGQYTCPGYMEDTDFINCNAKFTFDEVKRLEWNE